MFDVTPIDSHQRSLGFLPYISQLVAALVTCLGLLECHLGKIFVGARFDDVRADYASASKAVRSMRALLIG